MFEAETRLDILERLKKYYAELTEGKTSADEGTFSFDELSANAKEFEKTYAEMNLIIEAAFPQTSWGIYLDYLSDALAGLHRRQATAAEADLTISGKPGTVIPEGYIFSTENGISFATKAETEISDDGKVTVTATSTTVGAGGNVKAGTINLIPVPLYGVDTVTNVEAAHDGYEEETDDSLRDRLLFVMRRPVTSGNANHYWTWAMAVPGVGQCKVVPLWNGPGTVKVLIVDANNKVASAELIRNTYEYIEEQRPIGATVTVVSPEPVTIDIAATIEGTVNPDDFKAAVNRWLGEKWFGLSKISLAQISRILLECGATDYVPDSVTLNGKVDNVILTNEQIAAVGEVDIHVVTQ